VVDVAKGALTVRCDPFLLQQSTRQIDQFGQFHVESHTLQQLFLQILFRFVGVGHVFFFPSGFPVLTFIIIIIKRKRERERERKVISLIRLLSKGFWQQKRRSAKDANSDRDVRLIH
jgi:hypothetical protein